MKNVAITFEIFDKNNQNLNTFSFEGEQKKKLAGNGKDDSKNPASFKCESFGQFEALTLEGKNYIQAYLEFKCGENEQMALSKIGRLLIPQDNYQSFTKKIYLHSNYPDVVLKIKELGL